MLNLNMATHCCRLFFVFIVKFTFCLSAIILPELENEAYIVEGDIKIGYLSSVRQGSLESLCGQAIQDITLVEAAAYSVQQINHREDILPNVTIGLVVQDICSRDITALARAAHFAPDSCSIQENVDNATIHASEIKVGPPYKVVGVLGPANSREAVMVAGFLSIFNIPVLGTFSTSDELSDKSRFSSFMRLVPPDTFLVEAIVSFLQHMGWSYVSLLYSEGSFGENGAKGFIRAATQNEICIAYMKLLASDFNSEDYDETVKEMRKFNKSRAVVLFTGYRSTIGIFGSILRYELYGHFIFLGTYPPIGRYGLAFYGSFLFDYPTGETSPETISYLSSLNIHNSTNPWMKGYVESLGQCKWGAVWANMTCDRFTSLSDAGLKPHNINSRASKIIDGVNIFAVALNSLIKTKCPHASKHMIEACIKGPELVEEIKRTRYKGISDNFNFDKRGDMLGKYEIYQLVHPINRGGYLLVGEWQKMTGNLTLNKSIMDWSAVNIDDIGYGDHYSNSIIPKLVCSEPCGPKQYMVRLDLPCCWECEYCRDNEIINNLTKCEQCDPKFWPDENATKCVPISPQFEPMSSSVGLALSALATFGCLASGLNIVFLIVYSNKKLIKASGRELSYVILAGCLLSYISVFTTGMRPSFISCLTSSIGFNMANTLIFCPLAVKTNRIYRIFTLGMRGKKRPGMIGPTSQLMLTLGLVTIQIILSTILSMIAISKPNQRMPLPSEKYVELFCDWPVRGILVPLSYNLILVSVCAYYGFLTRKLPENFNESWYIFIAVTTTLFLWLAFLPTYFTAFYAYHKIILLSTGLILNASITLFCLYLPKVYAVLFVDEKKISPLLAVMSTTVTNMGSGDGGAPSTSHSEAKHMHYHAKQQHASLDM